MPDVHEPDREETLLAAYRAIPEPVRDRMPEEWNYETCLFWWCFGLIDDEFVECLWKTTEGALRVLEFLDGVNHE